MYTVRGFLILIFMSLAFSSQLFAQSCGSVFQNENAGVKSRSLRDYYGISYQNVVPVTGFQSQFGFLRTISLFHIKNSGSLIRVDVSDFQPSLKTVKGAPGKQNFQNLVEKNIEYVISHYQQRRDWSPDYLDAIQADAIKYAERSTYIVAHELTKAALDSEGKIIGSLKVVMGDKTNFLPFEVDHGIEVPLNGGLKFEPGNFVVLKEESTIGFGEVMSHFVRFAKDLQKKPLHNPEQMIFFTDADRASAMMYKQLGFKPVPGFEKPLLKNGKEYYLIGASTNTVLKFPELFENNRGEWGRGSTLDEVAQATGRMPLENALLRFERIEVEGPSRNTYTKDDWETLTRGGLNFYFHKDGGGRRLVFGREQGYGKLQFQEALQSSEFPLKPGLIRDVTTKSHGFTIESRIEYKDGILRIYRKTAIEQVEVLIETNSDFTDVKTIEYTEDRPGFDRTKIKTLQPPAISYSPPLW